MKRKLYMVLIITCCSAIASTAIINSSALTGGSEIKLSGYVTSEVGIKSGFNVLIDGTTTKAITDTNGYFETKFTSTGGGSCKVVITKDSFLKREINTVSITDVITIGNKDKPVTMWAGDINNDDSINMADVILIAKCFNTTSADVTFNKKCDLNSDDSITMNDVIQIAKHFNVSEYPLETTPSSTPIPSTPTPNKVDIPSGIFAVAVSNMIIVKWESVSNAKEYIIEVNGTEYNVGSATSYIHKGLTANSQYVYRIRAKNNAILSDWCSSLKKTTPLNSKAEYVYDKTSGRLDTIKVNGQAIMKFSYDKNGNMLKREFIK